MPKLSPAILAVIHFIANSLLSCATSGATLGIQSGTQGGKVNIGVAFGVGFATFILSGYASFHSIMATLKTSPVAQEAEQEVKQDFISAVESRLSAAETRIGAAFDAHLTGLQSILTNAGVSVPAISLPLLTAPAVATTPAVSATGRVQTPITAEIPTVAATPVSGQSLTLPPIPMEPAD